MPVFRYLFLLFLLVPLVEIYFLIQVGKVIGAGWTVFFVVFTAVLGAALLRVQGLSTLNRVQRSLERGRLPAVELLEGLMLLVAGALLLTPGFVTDAIGRGGAADHRGRSGGSQRAGPPCPSRLINSLNINNLPVQADILPGESLKSATPTPFTAAT